MDLDALQKALNNDGKITEAEREFLITRGIPDRLLEALEDGVLDDSEKADLAAMGISKKVIQAFADGFLSNEEKNLLRQDLANSMKTWREKQMKEMFSMLNRKDQTK